MEGYLLYGMRMAHEGERGEVVEYGKTFSSREKAYKYGLKIASGPEGWVVGERVPYCNNLPDGGCFWNDDYALVTMTPFEPDYTDRIWRVISYRKADDMVEDGKFFSSREKAYKYAALDFIYNSEGWEEDDIPDYCNDLPDGGCFWADDSYEVRITSHEIDEIED